MTTVPIRINDRDSSIFGILRTNGDTGKLVILLPAATGTRSGPQRIYVEIASALQSLHISSFSLDLPPNGDSYDYSVQGDFEGYNEYLQDLYGRNLDKVVTYFDANFGYRDYILLSISVGCLPVLQYAEKRQFSKVILLSPNLLGAGRTVINKKNLRAYREKIFQARTWKKLFSMRLNFKKILLNVFNPNVLKADPNAGLPVNPNAGPAGQGNDAAKDTATVRTLVILGERDTSLAANQKFWNRYFGKNAGTHYKEAIIADADHSFFGWRYKTDVKEEILRWLAMNQMK